MSYIQTQKGLEHMVSLYHDVIHQAVQQAQDQPLGDDVKFKPNKCSHVNFLVSRAGKSFRTGTRARACVHVCVCVCVYVYVCVCVCVCAYFYTMSM
jgi:hypothetical protein